MPQGTDFIFALQDKDYNFWSFDPNGNPVIGTRPYFMRFAPDGWNEIAIQNIKNKLYKGVDRSVSVPLGYVMDGGEILKHVAYDLGLRERVYLVIAGQQLDFEASPAGTIIFTGGGNPLTPGFPNEGTITGVPGKTVYIKFELSGATALDTVLGTIGSLNFNFDGLNPLQTYSMVIPPSGSIPFNIQFNQDPGTGTASCSMQSVNDLGHTVGYYTYWYKQLYRGEVDWATYDHSGAKITCQTLEDGLPKYLKANDKTVYEFPMNVPEAVYWKADGIVLHNSVENLVTNGFSTTDPSFDFGNHVIDLTITKEDAPYIGGKKDVKRVRIGNSNSALHASQTWFATTTVDSLITFDYDFKFDTQFYPPPGINPAGRFRVVIRRIDQTGFANLQFVLLNIPSNQVANGHHHLVGSGSIVARPGDEFYFFTYFDVEGATGDIQIQTTYDGNDPSFFNYQYLYRHPTTYLRGLRLQYLFEQLITKITEGTYTASISAFLYNQRTKIVMCGNSLRGLDDAVMKINLEDFFKFCDSVWGVGLVDRAPTFKADIIEEDNMTDFNNYIDLPEPALGSLKISVNKEILINEVTFGFPDVNNEVGVLNGKEEFNTNSTWSTNATTMTGKLEKISPVKASCYEIEKIRIATFNKDTTDYKNDNDNYVVHIGDVLQPAVGLIPAHYLIDRTLNPLVTRGLIEQDTVFNLYFTPARSFLRNGSIVHGRFYKGDAETFIFRNNLRNGEVICDGIIENQFRNIGSLAAQKVTPWMFDMETPPPEDLISLLDLDPLQTFRFPFEGNYYLGSLEKISIAPSLKATQQIQLRSAHINNMSQLKNYQG